MTECLQSSTLLNVNADFVSHIYKIISLLQKYESRENVE